MAAYQEIQGLVVACLGSLEREEDHQLRQEEGKEVRPEVGYRREDRLGDQGAEEGHRDQGMEEACRDHQL